MEACDASINPGRGCGFEPIFPGSRLFKALEMGFQSSFSGSRATVGLIRTVADAVLGSVVSVGNGFSPSSRPFIEST
jgi:hypothetical protein